MTSDTDSTREETTAPRGADAPRIDPGTDIGACTSRSRTSSGRCTFGTYAMVVEPLDLRGLLAAAEHEPAR